MKKIFIFIIFSLTIFFLTPIALATAPGVSINKICPSCIGTLQEAKIYIEQLEKRIKILHDDIARWMKLYGEEISSKASFLEKHMTNLVGCTEKFINLENKINNRK